MISVLARLALAAIVPVTLAAEINADLLTAAKSGATPAVKDLLAAHANELSKANSVTPALEAAAENGHTETVRAFLASPVVKRNFKTMQRAIVAAAKKGFIDTVELLTEGADSRLLDGALASAVLSGHIDLARVLLSKGADPDMQSATLDGPKHRAMILGVAAAGGAGGDACPIAQVGSGSESG